MVGELMEIIIYVQDMDAQLHFYRDVLGLTVAFPAGLDSYHDQFWVTLNTGACTLALHGGGKRNFGSDAPKFVFRVQEIRQIWAALRAKGVPMGEIRQPAPGIWVADGADPEGNLFSIEEQL